MTFFEENYFSNIFVSVEFAPHTEFFNQYWEFIHTFFLIYPTLKAEFGFNDFEVFQIV